MAMTGTHDGFLVGLSIVIAIVASYAALDLANRIRASHGWLSRLWLATAAVAMGGGIWSMHFIAMLALRMPGMAIAYQPGLTLLSLVLAILVTGGAFGVTSRGRTSPDRLAAAGLLMGLGVVTMHYVGMSAMRMPADVRYDPKWVLVSVVIAIGAATTALWLASRDRHPIQRAGAAVVMGFAVAGMHYAAMHGATFRAAAGTENVAGASRSLLVLAVTASTFLILTLALGAAIFDRHFTMVAGREARMRLRLRLADVMREADSDDALREASRLIGEHFEVARTGYGHLDADADTFDFRACWIDGTVPPLLGRLPAHDFGLKIVAELNAGRTVAVEDLMTSSLSDEAVTRATASAVDTRAILVVPFLRGGRLRTIFYLNDRLPRAWSADEVAFMEELAEHTRQIVARVEAEGELRQLNETLEARVAERTAELKDAEAALRQSQKMEAIGQLTGGIAHDFNNMLTGVIGNLDLLRRRMKDVPPETLERYVDAASGAARRAAALTARLLAYSRRQPLDSRPVDVGRLVRSLDDLLRTSIGERIRLHFDLPGPALFALADPHQLESAIVNLAINARDAMPDGGDLTIRAQPAAVEAEQATTLDLAPGDYVAVTVQDSGTGMPPDTAERAFEPFFTTKPVGQGTGLGLSMVYGFARQSGGQAQIASRPGEGTSVTVILPRALPSQSLAETTDQAAAQGSGQTILLVEDDEAVRPLVAELLRELGYRPIAVGNATDAVPILESAERIDLMVSDIGLPGMNGRDLADVARAHRPVLPILFVTGYAERAAHQGVSLDPGMVMITKPFEFETLAARVGEMLAGK